jgi:hypothetical protein
MARIQPGTLMPLFLLNLCVIPETDEGWFSWFTRP